MFSDNPPFQGSPRILPLRTAHKNLTISARIVDPYHGAIPLKASGATRDYHLSSECLSVIQLLKDKSFRSFLIPERHSEIISSAQ